MVLGQYRGAIGKFSCYQDVENVLNELNQAGFRIAQISVITNDINDIKDNPQLANEHELIGHNFFSEEAICAIAGALIGGISGFYGGLSLVGLLGVDFFGAVGAVGTVLGTTLIGSTLGQIIGSVVDAVVASKTLPKEDCVAPRGSSPTEYLVMISGTEDEIVLAEVILQVCSSRVWVC